MCGNFEENLLDFYIKKLYMKINCLPCTKFEPKISKLTQFCIENSYLNSRMRGGLWMKLHEKCEYNGN